MVGFQPLLVGAYGRVLLYKKEYFWLSSRKTESVSHVALNMPWKGSEQGWGDMERSHFSWIGTGIVCSLADNFHFAPNLVHMLVFTMSKSCLFIGCLLVKFFNRAALAARLVVGWTLNWPSSWMIGLGMYRGSREIGNCVRCVLAYWP